MVGINNDLVVSEKSLSSDGSTRLTTISAILIRGGVVSSSLISAFICYLYAILLSEEINFIFILFVLFILSIIILNVGIIAHLYSCEKTRNKSYGTDFFKNMKVYVTVSLILANWALSFIPYIVLIPFFMFFSSDFEGIFVNPFQAFIFLPSYSPDIIERYLFYNNNANIFRFLGLIFVILTLFLLMFQLQNFIQEKSNLQENFSPRLFRFELTFRLMLIFLLAYETILPLWDILFPNALFSSSNYQELFLLIDAAITPPLTLLCLIFLLLGSFRHSYFIIDNYDFLKKGLRKFTSKISSADEVV